MNPNQTPDLTALVNETAQLVEQAELVDAWNADQMRDIRTAHSMGLTVEDYDDRREAAIAEAESYGESGWDLPLPDRPAQGYYDSEAEYARAAQNGGDSHHRTDDLSGYDVDGS
jgi:hypothetical protein